MKSFRVIDGDFLTIRWLIQIAGVSYITFKTIGMYIDKRKSESEISFLKYYAFISFVPTLLIGPIDRYKRFESDINQGQNIAQFGGVDTRIIGETNGRCAPRFYKWGTSIHLLAGSHSGQIFHYTNISNNLEGTFDLVEANIGQNNAGENVFFDLALVDNEMACINQSVALLRCNDKVKPQFLKLGLLFCSF